MSRTLSIFLSVFVAVIAAVIIVILRAPQEEIQQAAVTRAAIAEPAAVEPNDIIGTRVQDEPAAPAAPASPINLSPTADSLESLPPSPPDPVNETLVYRDKKARLLTEGYGVMKPIALDDLANNPQKASVVEALATGTHPERVSVMGKRKPFDANAWKHDPAYRRSFLAVAEPGRYLDGLQPGPNVPVIRRASPRFVETTQDIPVTLSVEAVDGAPTTFTTASAGSFENGLSTITVEADAGGVASVQYLAGPGVAAGVTVFAGSPMTSGLVRYALDVSVPEKTATTP